MKTIIAALLSSAIAFPAFAGDVFSQGDQWGPHQPSGQTEGRGPVLPPKPVTSAWVNQPIAANGYANGWVDPSPGDLKRNQAENRAARRETYERIGEQGGCSAPVQPVEFAVSCDGFLASRSAFGGEQNGQMGSTGGD